MLNACELRLSSQQEEVQRRLCWLESREKAYFEAEELLQIRATQDEDRLEQGLENVAGWTLQEVEAESKEIVREKDEIIASRDRTISKLKNDLAHEVKRWEQARQDFRRARDERDEQK